MLFFTCTVNKPAVISFIRRKCEQLYNLTTSESYELERGIQVYLAGFQAHSQGGSWGGSGWGGLQATLRGGLLLGVCAPGGCLVLGGAWSKGVCSQGVPGSGGGGCVETPPGTATAVGGTHPTGMHSCLNCYLVHCMAAYFCYYLGFRIDISHIYRMTYPKKQSQFERVLSKLSMYIITNTNQTLRLSFIRDYAFWNGFSLYDR